MTQRMIAAHVMFDTLSSDEAVRLAQIGLHSARAEARAIVVWYAWCGNPSYRPLSGYLPRERALSELCDLEERNREYEARLQARTPDLYTAQRTLQMQRRQRDRVVRAERVIFEFTVEAPRFEYRIYNIEGRELSESLRLLSSVEAAKTQPHRVGLPILRVQAPSLPAPLLPRRTAARLAL